MQEKFNKNKGINLNNPMIYVFNYWKSRVAITNESRMM